MCLARAGGCFSMTASPRGGHGFSFRKFAMTQRDLNRAIARATGDDINTIARLGFVELRDIPFESEGPHIVDWDALDAERGVAVIPQHSSRARLQG